MVETENIFGINVSILNYMRLRECVEKDINLNKKSTIIAINPEKILKSRNDNELKELLNNATYKIPDGIGVVYASKKMGGKIKSRITGIDCMEMLCELSNIKGYKIFMFGASSEVVRNAKYELTKKYPKVNIVGILDGYEKDNDKIVETINKSGANILFVALGSPKQENWIKNNMNKLNVNIFQGVGGSFDVFSGGIKRAPKLMQKLGLEWLYRLIKEPKRIFRQINLFKFMLLLMVGRKK
ncbi:MAG: WecB/TagA/CpsF family glycosyltransferase [Bacilli bacterium]